MPRFKIGFLHKSTGRTVHFRRNFRNRRVLDFVGKFFEFGHKYRTSGTFLRKVPNSSGKRQKVPYVRYFLEGHRQKYRANGIFLRFLQIRLFLGKIAPSIAFFQFHRPWPRKNAKCPKNNRNCVPVFQSGSHLSGATLNRLLHIQCTRVISIRSSAYA